MKLTANSRHRLLPILTAVAVGTTLCVGSTHAVAARSSDSGEWAHPRQDTHNTGHQALPGDLKRAAATEIGRVGGTTSWVDSADLDGDGSKEVLYLTAGKVIAAEGDLTTKWEADRLNPADIIGVHDLDGDGVREVVGISATAVFVLDARDGSVLWRKDFGAVLSADWMKVADLDQTVPGLELVVWPYYSAHGKAFAFDQGVAQARQLWTSAPAYENPAYVPEVVVGDLDADGSNEVLIAGYGTLRAYDGKTGQERSGGPGWNGRVDFISGPGVDGRNYGQIQLINLDEDPQLEIVDISDGVTLHVAVIQNDASGLSLAYDRLIDYPENQKSLRTTIRSVGDLDGDGRVEMALNIFNDTGDKKWHLVVLDALTGFSQPEVDETGLYVHGVRDVDNDGRAEFFVSEEAGRVPSSSSPLKIYSLEATGLVERAQVGPGRFAMDRHNHVPATLSPHSRNSTIEVLIPDGLADFATLEGDRMVGYHLTADGAQQVWERAAQGDSLMRVQDFDGDGSSEVVLATDEGDLASESASGEQLGQAPLGALTADPTVADLDGDGVNEIVLAGLGKIRVLERDGKSFTERWSRAGKGVYVYLGNRQSVPLADMDADGDKELLIATAEGEHSKLEVVRGDGRVLWSHVFEDLPAPAAGNGIYMWTVGQFNGDDVPDVYVAAFSGGYNTEVSRILDGRDGSLIASRNQNPERPGIGFGPWVGLVGVQDIDGNGIEEAIFLAKDVVYAVNADTMARPVVITGHAGLYHNPTFANVDDDAADELVMHAGFNFMDVVDFSEVASGKTLWQVETQPGEYLGRHSAIADIDGDGRLEVASANASGVLSVRDARTGAEEWKYELGSPGTNLVSLDVNNDGRVDLVTSTQDGRVVALNGRTNAPGRSRVLWTVDIGVELGNVTAADIDSDGRTELVVAGLDGNLYAVDKP